MKRKSSVLFIFLFAVVIVALFGKFYLMEKKEAVLSPLPVSPILPTDTDPQQADPTGPSDTNLAEVFLVSPSLDMPIELSVYGDEILVVKGRARGNWFFEANILVKILDANGQLISEVGGQADEEWMTIEFVPFTAMFKIGLPPRTQTGKIVVSKDNPSGLPEHDKSVEFPVTFNVVGGAKPGE